MGSAAELWNQPCLLEVLSACGHEGERSSRIRHDRRRVVRLLLSRTMLLRLTRGAEQYSEAIGYRAQLE